MSSVAAPTYGMTVILSRYFLHPPTKSAARFHAERRNATEIRSGGGDYLRSCDLRRDEDYPCTKKKEKKEKIKRKKIFNRIFLSLRSFMRSAGLICAEGDFWRNQRKFAIGCLKNFGAVKLPGTKRDVMEKRILTSVNECISVN